MLDTIKIYPELVLGALNKNSSGAVRVWFLAKHYDRGNGNIPVKPFRHWLSELGISRSTYYGWIKQALQLGLMKREGEVYSLVSWGNGASIIGVGHLALPVKMDINLFISKGWLNYVWAGYLVRFGGKPIARETLKKLTGTPRRTQFERERKAGVKVKANYADMGDPKNDPEIAVYPEKEKGYYGKNGRVRRRLPNTYEPSGVERGAAGRTKQANKTIKNALLKMWNSSTSDRLYCQNYRQLKQASRRNQNPHKQNIFLYLYDRSRVGLWEGVSV